MRGLRERTQSTTTERWLADRYRLSTPDARTRVEQAHVFVRHPRLTEALTDGAVTVEQAARDRRRLWTRSRTCRWSRTASASRPPSS